MKKLILGILLLAGAHPVFAQGGYYCSATGFNANLGVTTKSFRCALERVERGVGTITFNGTTTVTSSGAFVNIVPPDAVPGADSVFFKSSGLIAKVGGVINFLRVSAKASNSSVTALAGTVASTFNATTNDWSYWNTTCYRSAANDTDTTDDVDAGNIDPRLWRFHSELGSPELTKFPLAFQGATSAAGGFLTLFGKSATYHGSSQQNGGVFGILPAAGQTARVSTGGTLGIISQGQHWTTVIQSHTADTFPFTCIYLAQ